MGVIRPPMISSVLCALFRDILDPTLIRGTLGLHVEKTAEHSTLCLSGLCLLDWALAPVAFGALAL